MMNEKNERPTKCSSNKGFGGKLCILHRTNFGGYGKESSPQSLTAATLDRCSSWPPLVETKSSLAY
jgi:hypothetical protein